MMDLKAVSLSDGTSFAEIFKLDDNATLSSVSQLYAVEAFYNRCVKERAKGVASVPLCIESDGGEPVWSEGERLPTNLSSLGNVEDVIFRLAGSLPLVGAGYALKRVIFGRFDGLQYFSPTVTEPVLDLNGRISEFHHTAGHMVETFASEDVLQVYPADPLVEVGAGYAEGNTARRAGDAVESLHSVLRTFLDRGLIRATLLSVEGTPPKEELQRLKRWWTSMFSGKKNAGNTGILQKGKLSAVPVGDGLKEMDTESISKPMQEYIATAFAIPHHYLFSNASNFATAEESTMRYITQTVMPDATRIIHAINTDVMDVYFSGMRFKLKPERMPIMQKAFLNTAQGVASLTSDPVLSLNEAREFLGLEPMASPPAELSREVVQDVRAWRKKIKSKGVDCDFSPDFMPLGMEHMIKSRLRSGVAVKDAFEDLGGAL